MIVEYPVTVPDIVPLERDYIDPPDAHGVYAGLYGYGSDDPKLLEPFSPDLAGTSLEGRVSTLPELLRAVGEGGARTMLEMLDATGVDAAVIQSYDTLGHEIVAKAQEESGGRLLGLAGMSPKSGAEGIRGLDHAISKLKLKGASIAPYANGMRADDQHYYPVYRKCADLGVPINIHASTNLLQGVRNDCGHPSHIDQVAVDFPDLVIIAHHGGWPWVLEMMSIALRHPNLYVSPSGMRPRHFDKPGGGWLPLIQFGDTVLRDRILWGSNWPMLPIRRSRDEIAALPLREESRAAWLGGNAARLFGINPAHHPASAGQPR